MKSCGWNKYSQLDKKSNNKDSDSEPIISPPCDFHVDSSSILSFSMYYRQTIWIMNNGKTYGIGDNSDSIISGLLPRTILKEDTEIVFEDPLGRPYKFISVVCGQYYTLYLVSEESNTNKLNVILCHKDQKPNPLFLNIGNRIPRALFGGDCTSGIIDTESGIIIIKTSFLKSPTSQITPIFLPSGDKPVKLVCCNEFVIALGQSGRIYETKLLNDIPQKFIQVKDLSNKTVVDISGTMDCCFAIINNREVFGRGSNYRCKLGLPEETCSVSSFTKIESLKSYKIVSVFAGSHHSIFKTSENKMIVCGWNKRGQLFIPPKWIVYPPEEVKICQGFSFCVTGGCSSTAFFDFDPPPNFSNMKIGKTRSAIHSSKSSDIKRGTTLKSDTEIDKLKQALSNKEKEISKLKEEIAKKEKENSILSTTITENNERIHELEKQLSKFQKNTKTKQEEQETQPSLRILVSSDISNFNRVKRIGRGSTSEVYEVEEKTKRALKILNTDIHKESKDSDEDSSSDNDDETGNEIDIEKLKRFLRECEVLNQINHPNIIKTFGFFFGDDKQEPAILLEYCESNLKKRIKKLSDEERIKIIVSLSSAMKEIHRVGIIHRDLKLENILLDSNNNVKVSDFGLCTFIDNSEESNSRTQMAGSLNYMAPELLQRKKNYDEKVDVYAFGVVVFLILTKGQYPDINIVEVGTGKQAPIPSSISKFSSKLIRDCWSFDSKDRPSFSEICGRLNGNERKLI